MSCNIDTHSTPTHKTIEQERNHKPNTNTSPKLKMHMLIEKYNKLPVDPSKIPNRKKSKFNIGDHGTFVTRPHTKAKKPSSKQTNP